MSIKPLHNFRGLTLIEVLITIVVFSTGILVILAVITNSLSLGSRSRNRTTATMLAKEGLEIVYNMRDTNLDKAQSWGCMPTASNTCAFNLSTISTDYYFTIDKSTSNGVPIVITHATTRASISPRLYYTGVGPQYTLSTTATTPTIFYRYIKVSPANVPRNTADGSSQTFVNSQIKKITSIVEYSQLGGTGKVEIESFIGLTR